MFSKLRNPRGGYSWLAIGLACLALSGFVGLVPLPREGVLVCAVLLVTAGAVCLAAWGWGRRRRDPYDLKHLFDEPPAEAEEPHHDAVPEDEESAPDRGWCDECFPPGTRKCVHCGRELGLADPLR